MREAKTAYLNIKVRPSTKEALVQEAEKQDVSLSQLIRQKLTQEVKLG